MSLDLADSHISVPDHVVRRAFPDETIVLNLESGQYHGLNQTAAAMLEAVSDGTTTPAQAAASLAEKYGQQVEVVREDLLSLLSELVERGLVHVVPST
jgi:PqqD family protein of HPr-rel-A system